jgi:hypothetical protein
VPTRFSWSMKSNLTTSPDVLNMPISCWTKLMMMKLFYARFVSQTRQLFMWMDALTGIIAEFGDQSNPVKFTSTFMVLQKSLVRAALWSCCRPFLFYGEHHYWRHLPGLAATLCFPTNRRHGERNWEPGHFHAGRSTSTFQPACARSLEWEVPQCLDC